MFQLGIIDSIFWCVGLICVPLLIMISAKAKKPLLVVINILTAIIIVFNLSLAVNDKWMSVFESSVRDWTKLHDYVFYSLVVVDIVTAIALLFVKKPRLNGKWWKCFIIFALVSTVVCNLYNFYTGCVNYKYISALTNDVPELLKTISAIALYVRLACTLLFSSLLLFTKPDQLQEEIKQTQPSTAEEQPSTPPELKLITEVEVKPATEDAFQQEDSSVATDTQPQTETTEVALQEETTEESEVTETAEEEVIVEDTAEEVVEEAIEEPTTKEEIILEETPEEEIIAETIEETVIEETTEESEVAETAEEEVIVEDTAEEVVEEAIEEKIIKEETSEEAVEEPIEQPTTEEVEEIVEETVAEETAEEVVEETIEEETAEEVVEETIEENLEEVVKEETTEETPVAEDVSDDAFDKTLAMVEDVLIDQQTEEITQTLVPRQEQEEEKQQPAKKLSKSKKRVRPTRRFVNYIRHSKAETQIPNMYCKNCGTRTHSESKVCPRCFHKMVPLYKCPQCGTLNETRECKDCGTKIGRR